MSLGFLRNDDDGHWYLVPSLFIADFDESLEKMKGLEYLDDPSVFDQFEEFFGKYHIDNPEKVKCIIDDDIL